MLNKIWCFFTLISIMFGIASGNIEEVNNSVFSSIENTMNLVLKMIGGMCFWNGIMNIAMATSLQEKLKKIIKPINSIIFPKLNNFNKLGPVGISFVFSSNAQFMILS